MGFFKIGRIMPSFNWEGTMPSLNDWLISCVIGGAKMSAHSFSSLVGMISFGAVPLRKVPMIFFVAWIEMGSSVNLPNCGELLQVLYG